MQLEMKLSELRMSAASADADAGSQRSQIARLERDVASAVAGLAGGGEEAERVALPGVLQRVAASHDDALRRAALLGVKPPPPPPTLAAALGVGVAAVELPTWSDWKELEEEGFDTVRLTWGGWAEGDKPDAPQPAPPAARICLISYSAKSASVLPLPQVLACAAVRLSPLSRIHCVKKSVCLTVKLSKSKSELDTL